MEDQLYSHPDRGEFTVARLLTDEGLLTSVNCRLRKVAVFNYASQYSYALIGYQVEYWEKGELPPYQGGEAKLYRPKNRPDYTTLYMRTRVANTNNMLYLEDAIINDFINSKARMDSLLLESYTEAAHQQVQDIAKRRVIKDQDVEYWDAYHVTRFASGPDVPLTKTEEWLAYKAERPNGVGNREEVRVPDFPFTSLKGMITKIAEHFNSQEGDADV